MSSYLHITNGDSTTEILKNINIGNEIITWREMLCEGRTTTNVGSEEFWKIRFDFLNTSYKVTKKTFIDFTLKEYRNLCNKQEQDEIVLWFDYDLFCQVNLIAVISWLKRYRKGRRITLVQSGTSENHDTLVGFAELSQEELTNLYNNRVELSQDDIEYADYIWQLYCSDSPLRLENVLSINTPTPFLYMKEAIKAHLLRFPTLENGLNKVENTILETANNEAFKTKELFLNALLKNQTTYGFGDLQYLHKIEDLKQLFSSLNPVKLNEIGKKVLEKQLNHYRAIRSDFSYLGGAKKYSYLYVSENDKLLKL